MRKIEILNSKDIREQPRIKIIHRNYAGLTLDEQKYIDSRIKMIDIYFKKRQLKVIDESGIYEKLSKVYFYLFDNNMFKNRTGGFCKNKTEIHLNTNENLIEYDITIHELIHLFLDIERFLGKFFNEGLVDYISGCIASENGIMKTPSYHINRILIVMLISIVGEDLLLRMGTSGIVSPELKDDFYALKIYGDSLYWALEKGKYNEAIQEIIECIGDMFRKVHKDSSKEETEQAKDRCIQQSINYMRICLADYDRIERELYISYYSNLFIDALSTSKTNERF